MYINYNSYMYIFKYVCVCVFVCVCVGPFLYSLKKHFKP